MISTARENVALKRDCDCPHNRPARYFHRRQPWLCLLPACALILGAATYHNTALSSATFSAIDIETTGFNPETNRIVEIAVVTFRNGSELASRSWLLNPGIPIPATATAIHGISNSMISGCPAFRQVLPELTNALGDSIILAHNASFDLTFLRKEAARAGMTFPDNPVIDTLKLARRLFPAARSHNIQSLCAHLALTPEQAHRATGDSRILMKIFIAMSRTLPADCTVASLSTMAEAVKPTPTDPQKQRSRPPPY